MNRSSSHEQHQRRAAMLVSVAVLGFAVLGSLRWWLLPRRAAAEHADEPALVEARRLALGELGEQVSFDERVAELRWSAPKPGCVEVYRVHVDEQFRDPSVAAFVGHEEEHSRWLLVIAARERGGDTTSPRALAAARALLMPLDGGEDPEHEIRERQLWWSSAEVGPAAPDLACRRRSWDPIEDALALGWPKLPARRVRVGEGWTGGAIGGHCHETTCLDDQGRFSHERPCRARPWHERLAGAGDHLALILGDWDDGHDPARAEIGILTSRSLVLDGGRPLWVRASVDHRWSGVRRELELRRIDDCSARTLAGPGDAALVEDARARGS